MKSVTLFDEKHNFDCAFQKNIWTILPALRINLECVLANLEDHNFKKIFPSGSTMAGPP